WLQTSGGWLCLVFQAKLLDLNNRYPGITKCSANGKPQVDLLLKTCLARSEQLGGAVWPLYCFYNSWHGGWPHGVQRFDGIDSYEPSQEELQLWGCAAATAWSIRRILVDNDYSDRRTARNSYLPISRPWSLIFPEPAESGVDCPEQIAIGLSSWMQGHSHAPSGQYSNNKRNMAPEESRRRDPLAVYYFPALIDQPPNYVFDVIEDRVRHRRLRPLARSVVVLPEP